MATPPPGEPFEPEWVTQVLDWSYARSSSRVPVAYTAPENMRLADRDDHIFRPVLVPIGPFHYGEFPAMEEHKTRILSSMLHRRPNTNRRELLMKLAQAVWTMEEDARGFYSKSFPDIDFVKMMVLDGCYLIEIFRMHAGLNMDHGDDPMFMARWMLPAVALDIVKLENQIPYSILKKLYEETRLPDEPPLKELAGSFLALLCPGLNKLIITYDHSQYHLLSLFHSTFLPNPNLRPLNHSSQAEDNENRLNSFPCVTDLCLSGIKVVKKKQGSNLLDIKYMNRVLEIPTLVIDHNTKILMRNLVAYEQCNKTVPGNFTSYVTFMDALVNSAEDVEVLRVAGVINHFMNSNEEVSVLLNNLTANIEYNMNKGYLADLSAKIYRAHHGIVSQWRARFKRLLNSREGTIYIITIFGLYLAVFQTVFTVLSYVHPK